MTTLLALLARPNLLLAIGGVVAVITVLAVVYHTGRGDERDEVLREIERSRGTGQDAHADAEACIYAGREWDQSAGVCR